MGGIGESRKRLARSWRRALSAFHLHLPIAERIAGIATPFLVFATALMSLSIVVHLTIRYDVAPGTGSSSPETAANDAATVELEDHSRSSSGSTQGRDGQRERSVLADPAPSQPKESRPVAGLDESKGEKAPSPESREGTHETFVGQLETPRAMTPAPPAEGDGVESSSRSTDQQKKNREPASAESALAPDAGPGQEAGPEPSIPERSASRRPGQTSPELENTTVSVSPKAQPKAGVSASDTPSPTRDLTPATTHNTSVKLDAPRTGSASDGQSPPAGSWREEARPYEDAFAIPRRLPKPLGKTEHIVYENRWIRLCNPQVAVKIGVWKKNGGPEGRITLYSPALGTAGQVLAAGDKIQVSQACSLVFDRAGKDIDYFAVLAESELVR